MRKYILLFLLCFFADAINAQILKPYDLVPYRKDTLWGFADTARKIIIAPKYDEVKFFDDAITAVRLGQKWAFIDKKGQELTAFKYDIVGTFADGMAQVRAGGKVGYVNNKAKEVVPPKFTFCEEFSEGLGIVRDSVNGQLLSGAVDKSGKLVLPRNYNIITSQFRSGLACISENDKLCFINRSGKKLQLPPNVFPYLEFSEGVAAVKIMQVKITSNSQRQPVTDTVYYLGLMDNTGKLLTDSIDNGSGRMQINADFFLAANFSSGFAIAQHTFKDYNWYAGSFQNNEFAFIDRKGKLTGWYSSVRPFGPDSIAVVTKRSEMTASFINARFKVLASSVYIKDAGIFSDGLLRVKKDQYGPWLFLGLNGETAIANEFDEVSDFYRGIAVVKAGGRTGCIDKKGNRFWE